MTVQFHLVPALNGVKAEFVPAQRRKLTMRKDDAGHMLIYHGSKDFVEFPEIRITRYYKDFGFGFYCTLLRPQAERWAVRFSGEGIVNEYEYAPDTELKVLSFSEMTEEWLDFIAACRTGHQHPYDIVEGPMANDTIFNYVQEFVDGSISRTAFWELARFKKPTHQISFHTVNALSTLRFLRGETVYAK